MPCVFTAGGKRFDVDGFLSIHVISPDNVWRRGEPQISGEPRGWNSFTCTASQASFDDFDQQVDDTLLFIERHARWLEPLFTYPGVEFGRFDFGVRLSDATIPGFCFPEAFVKEVGRIGLSLQISVY